MDAARFHRVEALFHGVRELPAERRDFFLRAECGDDAQLRAEVERFLAAESSEHSGPATDLLGRAAEQTLADEAASHVGRVIGVWRLVRPLGSGGMGSVFLAERNDGAYRTRVALKMLNPWLRGSAFEQRFALERQILSDLRHASIAALLDGGVTDDGVPYLVMEYVEGEAITQFAQIHNLDIDQRLRLLLPVCRAVQHAHQNLVIHRDLKPGNILVAADGNPKLLDFGIAKLLQSADAPDAKTVAEQTRLSTPEYASPEQMGEAAVTTASDVYSLGVILYELLTGQRPPRGNAESVLTPARPSSAIVRAQAARPARTEFGDAPLRKRWSRQLRGDLDTLVLKALAYEPARRYSTPQQLSEDIERYLRHQPLRARPDSLRYRVGKFLRRHRLGVALGAAALCVIVAAAVSLALLAVNLRVERDRSSAAQARAEQEARVAQRVSGFLERLFDGANPNQTQGSAPTLRDVLDRGARDVGEQLKDEPVVQAQLLVLMADAYRQLGEYGKGIAAAERAVELRRARDPVNPAELAESLDSLGELRRSNGDYGTAERLHREALELRRKLVPPDPMMVGRSMNNLALTLSEAGRTEEALPLYEESLALRRRALGDSAAPVLSTLVNIGLLRRALGDYAASEAAFREVYERRKRTLGEEHPATANVMTHLGHALLSRGHVDDAEPLLRRALQVRRKLIGERSPEVSIGLYELARALRYRGDLVQAEALLREAHSIDLEVFGPDNSESEQAIALLGDVLLDKGELIEAERMLRESLRLCRLRLSPDHPRLAAAESHLADALAAQRRYDAAEGLYRDALTIQRTKLRPGNGEIARTLLGLAQLARQRGDVTGARRLAAESAAGFASAPAEYDMQRKRLAALRTALAPPASTNQIVSAPRSKH